MLLSGPAEATQSGSGSPGAPLRLTFRSLWSLGDRGLKAGMAPRDAEQRSHKEHRCEDPNSLGAGLRRTSLQRLRGLILLGRCREGVAAINGLAPFHLPDRPL